MFEPTETTDDIAAGVMIGVMMLLLGCVFPAALLGQLAFRWDVGALNIRPSSNSDLGKLAMLLSASAWLIWTGFGFARRSVLTLLHRRAGSLD